MESIRMSGITVGGRLRSLRNSMKRTLKEESEIFEVSLNSVFRWEHDLAIPKKSMLRRIADYYDVSFEWLLFGEGEEKKAAQNNTVNIESCIEKQLLRMFKILSGDNKFKVLGYVERICIEDLGGELGSAARTSFVCPEGAEVV